MILTQPSRQLAAEHGFGAVQSRLYRFFREFQALAGFECAHVVDEPHGNHGPVGLRQAVDGGAKDIAQLRFYGLFFGVGRPSGPGHYPCALRRVFGGLEAPPPAQAAEGFVDCDASEPRREFRAAGELVEVGERAKVGFLNHVLSFGAVSDNRINELEQTFVVAVTEDLIEIEITGENSADRFVVRDFASGNHDSTDVTAVAGVKSRQICKTLVKTTVSRNRARRVESPKNLSRPCLCREIFPGE